MMINNQVDSQIFFSYCSFKFMSQLLWKMSMKMKVLKFQTQVCEFCIEHNYLFCAFFFISVDPLVLEVTIQEMGGKTFKAGRTTKRTRKASGKSFSQDRQLGEKRRKTRRKTTSYY